MEIWHQLTAMRKYEHYRKEEKARRRETAEEKRQHNDTNNRKMGQGSIRRKLAI